MGPKHGTPQIRKNSFDNLKLIMKIDSGNKDPEWDMEFPLVDQRVLAYILAITCARTRVETRHDQMTGRMYYKGINHGEHPLIFRALNEPYEQTKRNEIRIGLVEWAFWLVKKKNFWPDTRDNPFPCNPKNREFIDNMRKVVEKIERYYRPNNFSAAQLFEAYAKQIISNPIKPLWPPFDIRWPNPRPKPPLAADPRETVFCHGNEHVYFLLDEADENVAKNVKIGWSSKNMEERLKALQHQEFSTSNPNPRLLHLWHDIPGNRVMENWLHHHFHEHRHRYVVKTKTYDSEWFTFTPDIRNFLKICLDNKEFV